MEIPYDPNEVITVCDKCINQTEHCAGHYLLTFSVCSKSPKKQVINTVTGDLTYISKWHTSCDIDMPLELCSEVNKGNCGMFELKPVVEPPISIFSRILFLFKR